MIRLAGLFACIGVAVSLLLIAAWKASVAAQLWTIDGVLARLTPVLWPASMGAMALHAGSTTSDVIVLYTVLILANGVVYGVIGVVVAALMKLGRHSQ